MLSKIKQLKIPPEEKKFIDPTIRLKVFNEIYKGYAERYNLKLMYAFLNSDPNLVADYALIYSARNDNNTADIVLIDVPPIHSDRSTPGYLYCRKNKMENDFFQSGIDNMAIMEKSKFFEFVEMKLGLSRDKKIRIILER